MSRLHTTLAVGIAFVIAYTIGLFAAAFPFAQVLALSWPEWIAAACFVVLWLVSE